MNSKAADFVSEVEPGRIFSSSRRVLSFRCKFSPWQSCTFPLYSPPSLAPSTRPNKSYTLNREQTKPLLSPLPAFRRRVAPPPQRAQNLSPNGTQSSEPAHDSEKQKLFCAILRNKPNYYHTRATFVPIQQLAAMLLGLFYYSYGSIRRCDQLISRAPLDFSF